MSRSQTTSIKRPPQQAAADEGRSRLGDFTRPIPVEKRISRRPKVALFAGLSVLAIVAVLGAAIFILPIGTWRDQDVDLAQRQAELDELEKVNGQLSAEVDRLQTDDGIREAAREEIGFVEQGERRSTILPLPPLPTDLPDGWPYSVVTGIIAARRAGPAPTATASTEPATTEPATTEPATTAPATTEPVAIEPATTEPVLSEPPATTEPAAIEPATTEPATEPAAIEPAPTGPVAPAAD